MLYYLYIKQHRVTQLKYFGFTIRNPFEYRGSGVYWRKHLSKHGHKVDTIEIYGFDTQTLAREFALKFSRDNNIVVSDEWANLTEEDAANGGAKRKFSDETRARMSAGQKGKTLSAETRAKVGAAQRGKTVSPETRAKISASISGENHHTYRRKLLLSN